MRRASQLLWWFIVGGWVIPQLAQGAGSGELTVDQQRQHIAASRIEKMAELDAQDALCASRFAVNDCRQAVAANRRVVIRELRQQENNLNEMERQSRGAAQIQRLQERDRQAADVTASQRRHNPAVPIAPVPPIPIRSASSPTHSRTATETLAPADAEKNRAAFADKQRSALERQLARDKRLQEKRDGSTALPKPH